jgi:hypothetical protein
MTEAELGSVRAAARMNVPNGTTTAGQHTSSLGKNTPVYKYLKGLSYEIDFENVDKNRQILALIRAAAGF